MKTTDFARYYTQRQSRINQQLEYWLTKTQDAPPRLHQAMQYCIKAGGKRLRPLLIYATGEALGAPLTILDAPAVAIELIHTYSLVHDDLPSMDDDDMRRGQATCHKAFDEATAILVGDALQSLAFEILAENEQPSYATTQLTMLKTLANASGALGMAGGQSLDLQAQGQAMSLEQLKHMHQLKTGALIRAAIKMGALASGCTDLRILQTLDTFATPIGLAFQIKDDLLDIESHSDILGKKTGQDIAHHKITYPALVGISAAKQTLAELMQQALDALALCPFATDELQALAHFVIEREY